MRAMTLEVKGNVAASVVTVIRSVTAQWGVNGCCMFPETYYKSTGIGGWYAVRVVTDEGGVVPPPVSP